MEIQEPLQRPLYEAVIDALALKPRDALLDAGCGSGLASLLATQRGLAVTGLDASPAFIEAARRRCPGRPFLVADLREKLPFDARSFDAVMFINSLQFVPEPLGALREAARALRSGGRAAVAVFDAPERCQGWAPVRAILSLLPATGPAALGPFSLSNEQRLEALVRDAGFTPEVIHRVDVPWRYADLDTARRAFVSVGPAQQAREVAGEEALRIALDAAVEPYRQTDGSYLLRNVFMFTVGRKS